jgi:hypothetical protein
VSDTGHTQTMASGWTFKTESVKDGLAVSYGSILILQFTFLKGYYKDRKPHFFEESKTPQVMVTEQLQNMIRQLCINGDSYWICKHEKA